MNEMWLAALILGLPLVEISLFVTVGAWLGLGLTLAIVFGTAVLGIWLIRSQGSRAQQNLRSALRARNAPADGMASDVLIILAGILLVLPGFFTDICGLLLLLPSVQRALTAYVTRRATEGMGAHLRAGTWTVTSPMASPRRRTDEVIDTTWEELPEDDRRPPSGWTRH